MSKFNGLSTEFNVWMDTRYGKQWDKELDRTMITHLKNAFYAGASTTINAIRPHIGRAHYVRVENELITDIQDYATLTKQREDRRSAEA